MQVSILGCGWLGLPLAKSLIEKGFSVNGSTTSVEKIPILESFVINPFLINLDVSSLAQSRDKNAIEKFLQNSKILIINIPPKLRRDSVASLGMTFVEKIENLIPFIEKSSVKKVIFVSSTSVYGEIALENAQGEKNSITEKILPNPDTESGKQLLEVEKILQSNTHFKTTIVRFGGLIGNDRHPIYFLAGRKNIENPEAPINLIHLEDCIGIIHEILRYAQNDNLVLNAVAPFHPSRKKFYSEKAIELNLPLPEFEEKNKVAGKIISSEKVETVLNYKFQKPSL
ncbi:epimerase [Flavobacterium lutivivi]|nr:epimerase [Flavobacterium lutivivi]